MFLSEPSLRLGPIAPDDAPRHPAVLAWQRHLDAGRIGAPARLSPAAIARIRAAEAAICRGRGRGRGGVW